MVSLEAPTRISILDAINIMLANIGETAVSSYGGDSKPTAQRAAASLAEMTVTLQSEGHNFSTDRELLLTRDPATGHIALPDNILAWHPVGETFDLHLTEDDGKLYDTAASTFVFTRDVTVEAVMARPFTSLAQPVRWYIAVKAALMFANSENPGGAYLRVTAQMVEDAKRQFQVYDRRLRKGGLRSHNPHVFRQRGYR
jgi:hypothetical protein